MAEALVAASFVIWIATIAVFDFIYLENYHLERMNKIDYLIDDAILKISVFNQTHEVIEWEVLRDQITTSFGDYSVYWNRVDLLLASTMVAVLVAIYSCLHICQSLKRWQELENKNIRTIRDPMRESIVKL